MTDQHQQFDAFTGDPFLWGSEGHSTIQNGEKVCSLLVVDDNELNRDMLSRRLKRRGYDVTLAVGGQEAIDVLSQTSFDAVLLDIMMPAVNGWEVLEWIRERHSREQLPVIMATARNSTEDIVRALESGANDYVTKPLDFKVVLARVETHVSLKRTSESLVHSNRLLKEQSLHLAEYATKLESANRELTKTKAELEIKNQELDEFTYVASHDLQEPVRKLVSFSKLLEQDLGGELNENARRDLNFIVDAAVRMRQLVQDLLALSRTGRAAMKTEPVCLNTCLSDALNAMYLRIEESEATLHKTELPEVTGDRTMLTQLYQNLVGNALKFSGKNKPVVTMTFEDDTDQWILGVKDNGIGLKPEYADRIFKPFQRLHGRDQFEGTGIGLSICKKTVERHGGRLWVESTPEAGAHFKFTIPKQWSND